MIRATMTPFEVVNPKRRLRARRRQAIENLANLRSLYKNPTVEQQQEILEAKTRVTELQNANV